MVGRRASHIDQLQADSRYAQLLLIAAAISIAERHASMLGLHGGGELGACYGMTFCATLHPPTQNLRFPTRKHPTCVHASNVTWATRSNEYSAAVHAYEHGGGGLFVAGAAVVRRRFLVATTIHPS